MGYNKKIYVDTSRGLSEEYAEELLEEFAQYGPYVCIDWDEYGNSVYPIWLFSDPDFVCEGAGDYTFEAELRQYGNQHYLATAHTIKVLRTFWFDDDEIFDYFAAQGPDYFDCGGGALLEHCIKHCNGGRYFEMPLDDDWTCWD